MIAFTVHSFRFASCLEDRSGKVIVPANPTTAIKGIACGAGSNVPAIAATLAIAIGKALDMPAYLIDRHPFPGPGLGIRILGEIHPDDVKILQRLSAVTRSRRNSACVASL